jgi:hypothetical protein
VEPILKEYSEYAYNTLQKYFKIRNEIKLFEIWNYKLDNIEIESPLAIHTDNDNGDNIHTIILYTHKDSTIVDGNLSIYANSNESTFKTVVDTTENTIVCMSGNTYHKPNKMSGNGNRNCIVIQFDADD